MSNSTIIELRQLDSSDVSRNGFFRSTLDSPVLMVAGDQVTIKACYLDTAESSAGLIHLENDVPVEMEMAKYIQNYNLDQTFLNKDGATVNLRLYPNMDTPDNRTPFDQGDNAIWWMAAGSENSANTDWSVSKFKITLVTGNKKEYGGCNIVFKFKSTIPGDEYQYKTIYIKKRRRKELDVYNPYILDIVCRGKDGAPDLIIDTTQTSSDYLKAHQISSVSFKEYETLITTTATTFALQTWPINFTIPAGDYSPSQMAAVITDNLSNIEHDGPVNALYAADSASSPIGKTEWPAESPFLTTILKNDKYLQEQATASGTTIIQAFVNGTDYILEDGTDLSGTYYMNYDIAAMKAEHVGTGGADPYNPPLDKYVGGSQISMVFDPNEAKLKWDSLHFPIFVNESDPTATPPSNDATPGLIYNSVINTEAAYVAIPSGLAIRYAGVAFTKLLPQNFWEKQLGFTQSLISANQNAKIKYPTAAAAEPDFFNSFTISAKDGQQITGAYPGLGVGVIKSETTYSTPPFIDLNTTPMPTINISTPDTWGIFGDRQFNNSVADEGYFLVDVSPGIKQNLIGANGGSNSTQSIVNRYYTQNSFTSDQGAGSISYTHEGEPQLLSDFQVRVLNPDKSPVNETILQEKNSIFIEIIKPVKQDP